MRIFMKSLLLAATMIPMIYALAQDTDDQIKDLQAQIQEIRVMAESRQVGAQSPAGYPKIEDAVGLRFELGGLYQNAVLDGTEYAELVKYDTDSYFCESTYHDTQVIRPQAKMGWGVDGAISYYFQDHGYEIKLRNSYYDLSISSYLASSSEKYIYPVSYLGACNNATLSKYAHNKLDITYDLLGLELQKSFFVNRYFSIDAVGGLLASWTWFTSSTKYTELNFNDEYPNPDSTLDVNKNSSWFGIGPELGFNLNFTICQGFSLFFNNVGALMYGRYDLKNYQEFFLEAGTFQDTNRDSQHSILPYVQSFMGLAYEFYLGHDSHFLKIRAGYNTQYFFAVNRMYNTNSDLQTQGLKFDLAWSF